MSVSRIALVLGFFLLAGAVQASPVNALSGLTVPADTTIDFDDLSPGEAVAPDRYAGSGVTLTGLSLVGFNAFGLPGFSGTWINGGGSPTPANNLLEISFAGTVTAAAFRFQTNPGTSVIDALLNGVVVETYSPGTTVFNNDNWVGFESVVGGFDTLRVLPGGTNGAHHIENLQFSGFIPAATAPAPATVLLLGLGLVGVGMRRRSR